MRWWLSGLVMCSVWTSQALVLEYPCVGSSASSSAYLFTGNVSGEYVVKLVDLGSLENSQMWVAKDPVGPWTRNHSFSLSSLQDACLAVEFSMRFSQECRYDFQSNEFSESLTCQGILDHANGNRYTIYTVGVGDGQMSTVLEEGNSFHHRYLFTAKEVESFVDKGFWFDELNSNRVRLVYGRSETWNSGSHKWVASCTALTAVVSSALFFF